MAPVHRVLFVLTTRRTIQRACCRRIFGFLKRKAVCIRIHPSYCMRITQNALPTRSLFYIWRVRVQCVNCGLSWNSIPQRACYCLSKGQNVTIMTFCTGINPRYCVKVTQNTFPTRRSSYIDKICVLRGY